MKPVLEVTPEQRRTYISFLVLVALNLVDIEYTRWAFEVGGVEANPVTYFFYKHWGMWGIIVFKAVMLSLVVPFLPIMHDYSKVYTFYCLMIGAYIGLTAYHLWVYVTIAIA